MLSLLADAEAKAAAEAMRQDFLSCAGPRGAADFIEAAARSHRA